MEDEYYLEPFLAERIESAKAQAEILSKGSPTTQNQFVLTYRMLLSEHYNIPFYSSYFDERTMDEMIFEFELIKMRNDQKNEVPATTTEIIKTNVNEAAEVASSGWGEEVKLPINDKELEQMKQFMDTGEFVKPGEPNVKK